VSKIESEADSRLEARARRVVIGTVPYLNVQPLIWALETGRVEADAFGGHPFEIVPAHPRELAGRLRAGEFDVAIVPVFEYFLTPGYCIVPTGALATQREVGSVTVFSDAPLEEVSQICLDPSSLTSVNLLRVLAAERGLRAELFENHERFQPGAPLAPGEARLLIGDPAIASIGRHRFAYDLGRMWHDMTGLPFVFAAWLVHPRAEGLPLGRMLGRSRQIGAANLDRIADESAARFGTTPDFARRYFRANMSYELGERELAGWRRFWELSHRHGLAGAPQEFEFHEE
jgi:chorismate dehydratase